MDTDMMPNNLQTADSAATAASTLKLFEHERRISVVEKDVERQGENIVTLTKEVYGLPATIRDLMDSRIREVSTDANEKFEKLTSQISKVMWPVCGGLIALVGDILVHTLPH